mmetsp:Transcript_9896/g.36758  ORF Transcript_9896/g.36758 Transcript_9896/m.36758 type:complete len:326 (+) Transcript_9896:2239-3216(+)
MSRAHRLQSALSWNTEHSGRSRRARIKRSSESPRDPPFPFVSVACPFSVRDPPPASALFPAGDCPPPPCRGIPSIHRVLDASTNTLDSSPLSLFNEHVSAATATHRSAKPHRRRAGYALVSAETSCCFVIASHATCLVPPGLLPGVVTPVSKFGRTRCFRAQAHDFSVQKDLTTRSAADTAAAAAAAATRLARCAKWVTVAKSAELLARLTRASSRAMSRTTSSVVINVSPPLAPPETNSLRTCLASSAPAPAPAAAAGASAESGVCMKWSRVSKCMARFAALREKSCSLNRVAKSSSAALDSAGTLQGSISALDCTAAMTLFGE